MFDFPSPATTGQQIVMPDGTVRIFDGTKWKAGAAPATGPYLPLSGGTLSGGLTLNADPASALMASTKQYTDAGDTTVAAAAQHNAGRSYIHNGMFNIQQRGAGPWTASGSFTADRWLLGLGNDTVSISLITLADADRTAIGDEAALAAFQSVFTGSATAGSASNISQHIETVRRLSGKNVILSFWARATSGTPRIGMGVLQYFGNGGSPSPSIFVSAGATAPLTTTWTRYTGTAAIPSASGKVFGTNAGTDFTQLALVFSDQANSWGTGIGVQSGTVQLWGVQLEIGTQATPLEKLDPVLQLQQCSRFFQGNYVSLAGNASGASIAYGGWSGFGTQMRATPTIAFGSSPTSINVGAASADSVTPQGFRFLYGSLAAGAIQGTTAFTASADL